MEDPNLHDFLSDNNQNEDGSIMMDEFSSENSPMLASNPDPMLFFRRKTGAAIRSYERKLAENEPLDNHEQEELIQDMRAQSHSINYVWRMTLTMLGVLLMVLMAILVIILLVYGPTVVGFHKRYFHFLGVTTIQIMQISSLGSYIAVFFYAKNYPNSSEDRFIIAAVTTSVSTVLSLIILLNRGQFNWATIWMPLFNCIYFSAAFLALRNKKLIDSDLKLLEQCRYKFNSL